MKIYTLAAVANGHPNLLRSAYSEDQAIAAHVKDMRAARLYDLVYPGHEEPEDDRAFLTSIFEHYGISWVVLSSELEGDPAEVPGPPPIVFQFGYWEHAKDFVRRVKAIEPPYARSMSRRLADVKVVPIENGSEIPKAVIMAAAVYGGSINGKKVEPLDDER